MSPGRTMSWIIVTFVVGALNLILGFTLAVQLGVGPRTLEEAWAALLGRSPDRAARDAAINALIETLAADPQEAAPVAPPPETQLYDLVVEFQPELLKNEANLIQVDSDLRATESLTTESLAAHAEALQAKCEAYLADLGKTLEQLQSQIPRLGTLKPLGQQIEQALVEQSSRFDAAVHSLTQRDPAEEPAAVAERLTQETVSLLSVIHRFRDYLATAFLAILRHDPRLRKVEDRQKMDPLTKTPNRIGMELQLQEWWEQNRFRDRENCAILVDFDRFENINLQFGAAAGKHVLRTVVEQIQKRLGPNDSIFRHSGQQIAIFLGVESAAGVQTARSISTMACASPISYGKCNIPVRITGTVIPILAKNRPGDILARLEEELRTAKRITPGRIYLSDKAKAPPSMFTKGEAAAR